MTMDDAELVKLLRNMNDYEPLGHDGWKAADRIEALIAERDAALDAAMEEAAKVDQLRENIRHLRREWYLRDLQGIDFAAALHTLKGKSHE